MPVNSIANLIYFIKTLFEPFRQFGMNGSFRGINHCVVVAFEIYEVGRSKEHLCKTTISHYVIQANAARNARDFRLLIHRPLLGRCHDRLRDPPSLLQR